MATMTQRHATHPISHYWDMVKDLDNSQKLELITLLAESVKPAMDKSSLRPYTKEELLARIAKSEQQLADGKWQDFDDAMDELEKEFAEEDKKLEMAEVL